MAKSRTTRVMIIGFRLDCDWGTRGLYSPGSEHPEQQKDRPHWVQDREDTLSCTVCTAGMETLDARETRYRVLS